MAIRVLHVEDDADIRQIAQLALEFSGQFELRQCGSGPEALEAAPDFAPDVFLLDVMMPGMSGDEVFDKLRTMDQFKDTPVIFMTARAQPSEVRALRDRGATGVIVKPFDPTTLGDEIVKILEGA